jgi:hypothetical protein
MGSNYGGWPRAGNQVPAGRLLVVGETDLYGFGRNQYIHHGAHLGIDGASIFHFRADRDSQRRFTHYRTFAIRRDRSGGGQTSKPARPAAPPSQYRWIQKLPILARAMVLADQTLFLAGPPGILATEDPLGALEGAQGGTLLAVATSDGGKLAEFRLESPPVFDGMAAADGRLYLSTIDGSVLCFRGRIR